MEYKADEQRYQEMLYVPCGRSSLRLPRISLGLWHNFGAADDAEKAEAIILKAFDKGVTHFDLANNYGPPPGTAEETFGRVMQQQLKSYRDEILVSTKAGHAMWPGPYGDECSRKSLMASLDQSLRRMRLDYVDIFYSHRYDGVTPLDETVQALIDIVRKGKALYAGLSKYPPELAQKAYDKMAAQGVPCLIHQDRYSMLARKVEKGTLETAHRNGVGFIAFSPLAQGLLTDKYLQDIPEGSRATKSVFLKPEVITPDLRKLLNRLNTLALRRGESLAQLALTWLFGRPELTSVIVGAGSVKQLEHNLSALAFPLLTEEEEREIHTYIDAVQLYA